MYNNRRVKNNNLTKNVKDYIIPIIIVLFVILIIFNIFRGDNTQKIESGTNEKVKSIDGINITFKTDKTKAFVINKKNKKNKLTNNSSINFGDKILVESGIIDFKKDKKIEGIINARGELEINENSNFKLLASDLFLKSKENTKIEMKFLTVNLNNKSVVSFSQNEVSSSIYVLSGFASVTTRAKKSIFLTKGKKITILSKESHQKDLDIKSKIVDIEKSYLDDTWCGIINCSTFLQNNETKTSTGATTTEIKKPKLQKTKLIEIVSVLDGEESFEKKINIKGKIFAKNISDITINNIPTKIDHKFNMFTLNNFELKENINDIIYKVFDNSGDLIGRGVITIYYTGGIGKNGKTITKAQTINYPKNDKYIIELPGASPFVTTETKATIKGRVPAGIVSKIMVNNFTLTKFIPNSTLWWYHANMLHGNMKNGTNEYKLKYFGHNGEILYEDIYFIIKK